MDPLSWTVDEVIAQICDKSSQLYATIQIKPVLNLETLEKELRENDVDGESLLELDDKNVKDDLHINSFGQRREIRKIVQYLRSLSEDYRRTPESHVKRSHAETESDFEPPSDTNKRRRIAPINISSLPTPKIDQRDTSADGDNEAESEPNADTNDRSPLPDDLLDLLVRYPEDDNDEGLALYGQSDAEKDLDSDDSMFDENDETNPPNDIRITRAEVVAIIEDQLGIFKQKWIASKKALKFNKARRNWMEAAKAGTRRPKQNFFARQLENAEARLEKFRSYMVDAVNYANAEEVRYNCFHLQATVDDIMEQKYYLEVLESNIPPEQPPQDRIASPEMPLQPDEEALHSSEDEAERSVGDSLQTLSDTEDAISAGSDGETSLSYDPADNDWHPVIPQPLKHPKAANSASPVIGHQENNSGDAAHGYVHPQNSVFGGIQQDASASAYAGINNNPAIFPRPFITSHDSYSGTSSTHTSQSPVPYSNPFSADFGLGTPARPTSHFMPALVQHSQPQMTDVEDEIDPDLDIPRLPPTQYRLQGKTIADAIMLSSSPSGNENDPDSRHNSTDDSIRTPPLNPVTPDKGQRIIHFPNQTFQHVSRPRSMMTWPDIYTTRKLRWEDIMPGDAFTMLCKAVYRRDREVARKLLQLYEEDGVDDLVDRIRAILMEAQDQEEMPDEEEPTPEIVLTQMYICWVTAQRISEIASTPERYIDEAFDALESRSKTFLKLFKALLMHYMETRTIIPEVVTAGQDSGFAYQTPSSEPLEAGYLAIDHPIQSLAPFKPSRPSLGTDTDLAERESETDMEVVHSARKIRKRAVQQSQEAEAQQKQGKHRVEDYEKHRAELMERFESQTETSEVRQISINVREPYVYIPQHISRRIKEHQISGVQFIWRELVDNDKAQGCLLAHTMGLGKTMQVITFLCTIAQAQASPDPSIRDLVPVRFRDGKTLVLCPASLVDNWYDELLMWTPRDTPRLLGNVVKVGSETRRRKIFLLQQWEKGPGILIISYESFRSLLKTKKDEEQQSAWLSDLLLQKTNIVVADEAHKLKNQKSSITKTATQFKTKSRIALTGSPLNNHLEEYHTMIDWIAPNYLGNLRQFKAKYSEPIERGLWHDSTKKERRESARKLYVLKRDLAPKIDRKDISAIAADMPQKTEFFITVPLTELQRKVYTIVVEHFLAVKEKSGKSTQADLWSWLAILSWLNNHPSCLVDKLRSKDEEAYDRAISNYDDSDDGTMPQDLELSNTDLAGKLPEILECFREVGVHPEEEIDSPDLSVRAIISQQLIENSVSAGEKILLFSHSIPTLNFLQAMLQNMGIAFMRIDGSTKTDHRQAATKQFNAEGDSTMVFLVSTRAGGLGLNLQGANRVIIYDFNFNPSWEEQAIGRAYRLGQKKPVFVYRFCAGGTFEDTIKNKSIFKTQLFSQVVDARNVISQAKKGIEEYIFVPKDCEADETVKECQGKDELLDKIIQTNGPAIRNVILTETFVQENDTQEITEDDIKELDVEVRLNEAARQDPSLSSVKSKDLVAEKARLAKIRESRETLREVEEYRKKYPQPTTFAEVFNPRALMGDEILQRDIPLRTVEAGDAQDPLAALDTSISRQLWNS